MRPIRLYLRCEYCNTRYQIDLPRIGKSTVENIREYNMTVFIHDCTKTGWNYPAGTFGIAKITGGKEL